MELCATGVFLGSEQVASKKTGEIYTYVAFAVGMDSLRLTAPATVDIRALEMYKPYKVVLDYNTAFKSFKMVSVDPAK